MSQELASRAPIPASNSESRRLKRTVSFREDFEDTEDKDAKDAVASTPKKNRVDEEGEMSPSSRLVHFDSKVDLLSCPSSEGTQSTQSPPSSQGSAVAQSPEVVIPEALPPKKVPKKGKLEEHTRSDETRARIARSKIVSPAIKQKLLETATVEQRAARTLRALKLQQLKREQNDKPLLVKKEISGDRKARLERGLKNKFSKITTLPELKRLVEQERGIFKTLGKSDIYVDSALETIQTFINMVNSRPSTMMRDTVRDKLLLQITQTGKLREFCWGLYQSTVNSKKEELTDPEKAPDNIPS